MFAGRFGENATRDSRRTFGFTLSCRTCRTWILDEDRISLRPAAPVGVSYKELGIRPLTAVVHRYENPRRCSTRSSSAFERPARAAGSPAKYRRLVSKLIEKNPADRDGVLRFLHQAASSDSFSSVARDISSEVKRKLGIVDPGNASLSVKRPPLLASPGETVLAFAARLRGEGDPLEEISGNFLDDADVLLQVGAVSGL